MSSNAPLAPQPDGGPPVRLPAVQDIDKDCWEIAVRRYEIVRPAIEAGPPYRRSLMQIAQATGHPLPTLYRWLERFNETGDKASLLPQRPSTRRSTVSIEAQEIIRAVFDEFYADKQRHSMTSAVFEVRFRCDRAEVREPHINTIRNHLKKLRAESGARNFLRMRGQRKAADALELRPGTFKSEAPWSRVQIDHTILDVMVVDDEHRLNVGRPYITIAIDSFSREILGFYISLDPVGRLSTGLCLLHAMLPKDVWLKEHGVSNAWPCYGKPAVLHFDNGKEFLSKWIQDACARYDIQIEHRPVADPHFGPHVERGIRTLNGFLRSLKGKTFSNPRERAEYASEDWAVFTLFELEGVITEWITGTYRRKRHRGLKRTPQAVYESAILGTPESRGTGRRILAYPQERLRLDFLPYEERTVQHYGIALDGLIYVGEVLGRYVGAKDDFQRSKKFKIYRDPRCINEVYFYASDVNEFYRLALRDVQPNISLWEWRALRRRSNEEAEAEVDQAALFESYARIREREAEAAAKTKAARKNATRRLHHSKVIPLPTAAEQPACELMWDEEPEPYDNVRML